MGPRAAPEPSTAVPRRPGHPPSVWSSVRERAVHELSLAQSICRTVADHVTSAQRIVRVVIEWGPLSGVVPEALDYCFGIVAPSLGLGQAELEIRRLPAAARCPACQQRFEIETMWASCPHCGHAPVTVMGGDEFRLKEIEVEDV